ncbi:S-layer protein domain-containing protein [Methanolobus sp. ZRKC5]|uniref:S-layer protein domain-containing protein n=1 Tax=unclassified Methanolobus TaxID=2629569 RepID=UPI00313CE316
MASSACADSVFTRDYNEPLIIREYREPLLINGTGIFLTTGNSWNFYQGYIFTVSSVNLEKKQVWVKLLKEDELLKEAILSEDEKFIYCKDEEILNITVDTIYISSGRELITFKPVYQYQDSDLPDAVLEEDEENNGQSDDNQTSGNSTIGQTSGFTIFQTFACISFLMACRRILN